MLAFFFVAAPLVRFTPLAVISGILSFSVCTMSHWRETPLLMKSSRTDACAWLATAMLTIATDLLTAIAVGVLIGTFLYFQKRRSRPPILSQ